MRTLRASWATIRRVLRSQEFLTFLMTVATAAIAVFTYQQVRVNRRLLQYEEYGLKYALRVDSVRILTHSAPESLGFEAWWRNISRKPVLSVFTVPQFTTFPLETLGSWPLPHVHKQGPLQMYPGDTFCQREMIHSSRLPKPEPKYVWLRVHWKTPREDGYGAGWSCQFDPSTGKKAKRVTSLSPKWKYYSRKEIRRAETPRNARRWKSH